MEEILKNIEKKLKYLKLSENNLYNILAHEKLSKRKQQYKLWNEKINETEELKEITN